MIPGDNKHTLRESTASYYDLLGVASTCSIADVHDAYRRLAEMYMDPDTLPPDWEPLSPELFNRITQAFRVLSDEVLRKEYDSNLEVMAEQHQQEVKEISPETSLVSLEIDGIPESWRKEREYFEEHFEEIFKPLPKVNLVATEPLPDGEQDAGLSDWEGEIAPPIDDSAFGTLPISEVAKSDMALPQPRRVIPSPSLDQFQLIIVGGIVLMSLVIIAEIIYLYGVG